MRSDVLRRVRWGNVARAVGVVAVVAAIVGWPGLMPPAPSVPGDVARPLVEPRAPAGPRPLTEAELRGRGDGIDELVGRGDRRGRESVGRGDLVGRGDRAGGGGGGRDGPEGAGGGEAGAPVPVVTAAPGPAPAPPVVDPAQAEFGIEGG